MAINSNNVSIILLTFKASRQNCPFQHRSCVWQICKSFYISLHSFNMDFDYTAGLNLEESKALKELKGRISKEVKENERYDDSLYLRFLRARDFNVKKAEEMLRNTLAWREKQKIDDLIHTFIIPEVYYKYFPMTRIGFDYEGHPVHFFDFGNFDLRGILHSCDKVTMINCVLHYLETDLEVLKSQSEILGKPIETWTYIADFENFSFAKATRKADLEVMISLAQIYESNYPERLKYAIVVNASLYFTVLFAVIKPLLTGNTLKKIQIYGRDGWKKELLKVVSPEILPVHYGGTRTDSKGDPKCSAAVKYGSEVPKSYYSRSPQRRLAMKPGVQKYFVSRMSKIDIVLDVKEPGSYIEWEFETENRDIGFCLYFRETENGKKLKPLIPKQRVESHLHCEAGMYKCEFLGTYILVFDNSYSWFSQKEVFCKVAVVNPNDKNTC